MKPKNGDMPAMPTDDVVFVGDDGYAQSVPSNGMTKFETMVMHFMASCHARDSLYDSWYDMASDAVGMAEAALSAIEDRNNKNAK